MICGGTFKLSTACRLVHVRFLRGSILTGGRGVKGTIHQVKVSQSVEFILYIIVVYKGVRVSRLEK